MGKTSKFSFPLPGRKVRSEPEAPVFPEERKLSKAERLLGASNLPVNNIRQVRKQPSSLTLHLYEPSIAEGFVEDDEHDYPVPELPQSHLRDSPILPHPAVQPMAYGVVPRSTSMKQKQSPRLQQERKHPRSMSSNAIPNVRHFKSAISLNGASYKPIPTISERPSAAAIRKMASKPDTPYYISRPGTGLGIKTQESAGSSSDHSPKRAQDRKRPSRLDLSKLFPKSGGANSNSSTSRVVSSPTSVFSAGYLPEIPMLGQDLMSPSSLSLKSQRKLSKSFRHASADQLRRPKTAGAPESTPAPAVQPIMLKSFRRTELRKTKHWADGLLEAEDQFEIPMTPMTPDISDMPPVPALPQRMRPPVKPRTMSRDELSIRVVERSSPNRPSPGDSLQAYDNNSRRTSWQSQIAPLRASILEKRNQYTPGSRFSVLTQSTVQRDSILSQSTTQRDSVLSQSTVQRDSVLSQSTMTRDSYVDHRASQAEPFPTVEEADTETEDEDSDLPDVRASIAFSDIDETVTIGEAQAFEVRPRHMLGNLQLKTNTQMNGSATFRQLNDTPMQSPQAVLIPAASFRKTSVSSGGKTTPIAEQASRNSADSSGTTRRNSITPTTPGAPPLVESRHKMMAVTAEEEALLAMMRQKRAAMASHSFAAGYKTALLSSPQSPMFVNVRRESRVDNITVPRSRPSMSDNIQPPLSPPPSTDLPTPPEHSSDPEPRTHYPRESLAQSISTISSSQSQPDRDPTKAPSVVGLDTLYTKLHALQPNSPTMTTSGLSMSPSNTSQLSALPSPVTPDASRSTNDLSVIIADPSSRTNSNVSERDILERNTLDSQKSSFMSSTSLPLRREVAASIASDDDGASSIEVHPVSNETTPNSRDGQHTKRTVPSSRMPAPYNYGAYSTAYVHQHAGSFLASAPHVHENGCCAESDARCSVVDDVMAAWGDLGGWQVIRS